MNILLNFILLFLFCFSKVFACCSTKYFKDKYGHEFTCPTNYESLSWESFERKSKKFRYIIKSEHNSYFKSKKDLHKELSEQAKEMIAHFFRIVKSNHTEKIISERDYDLITNLIDDVYFDKDLLLRYLRGKFDKRILPYNESLSDENTELESIITQINSKISNSGIGKVFGVSDRFKGTFYSREFQSFMENNVDKPIILCLVNKKHERFLVYSDYVYNSFPTLKNFEFNKSPHGNCNDCRNFNLKIPTKDFLRARHLHSESRYKLFLDYKLNPKNYKLINRNITDDFNYINMFKHGVIQDLNKLNGYETATYNGSYKHLFYLPNY